ncbi:MAG: polyprenyl synthetase family protein [Nitrospirota bacterium]|nr:polyprenyl synthetase family protein [Nitrospirota bacterium]
MNEGFDLKTFSADAIRRVDEALSKRLGDLATTPPRLAEAMRYAVLGGGKRVRPVLAIAAFQAAAGHGDAVLPVAGALELIHTYSLVHDDLPAMDNDDLRRGRPTCHKAFDEATAILVGDGLQSLAFTWLAEADLPETTRLRLVSELAAAAGPWGMVGGQMLDMEAEGKNRPRTLDHLRTIHAHKTGALLASSVRMGALAAGADTATLVALTDFGRTIGLAFQVADDVLDETADTATLGKTAGKDSAQGKLTYPLLMGTEEARNFARSLKDEAITRLTSFGPGAAPLRALATYIVERDR